MTEDAPKTVLITGASRGIGRATAISCGARGWSVLVNYASNENAARQTVAEIEKAGGRAFAQQGDVSREPDVVAMFDACEAAFGPVTGFVNNAGIIAPIEKLADMKADRMRRIVDVNVFGVLLAAREAARRMARSRGGAGGTIVNVSSMAARLGSPNEFVDYAASRGAVDTLTVGMARELGGDGVRVNGVRPGLIDTDIQADTGLADRAGKLGKNTPIGRAGTAQEVAEAIVWLLSDASSYVTGAFIDVSGGR